MHHTLDARQASRSGAHDIRRSDGRSRWRRIAAWTLQVALAAAFIGAGSAKLAGVPDLVAVFDRIDWGRWLLYVTAALEIGGGLLLLWPRRAWLGAALLACVATGAAIANVTVLDASPIGALVLLAAALAVLWLRRPR